MELTNSLYRMHVEVVIYILYSVVRTQNVNNRRIIKIINNSRAYNSISGSIFTNEQDRNAVIWWFIHIFTGLIC